MEKMIDTIVEMDKKARLREQEAEDYKSNQMKALDGRLQQIDEQYRRHTQQEIQKLTQENQARVLRHTQELNKSNEQALSRLEAVFQAGREAWANEIVQRVLAGE